MAEIVRLYRSYMRTYYEHYWEHTHVSAVIVALWFALIVFLTGVVLGEAYTMNYGALGEASGRATFYIALIYLGTWIGQKRARAKLEEYKKLKVVPLTRVQGHLINLTIWLSMIVVVTILIFST